MEYSESSLKRRCESDIKLCGFYISPLGSKVVTTSGREAVEEVKTKVDFHKVIKEVIDFFNNHQETVEDVKYTFELSTAERKIRGLYLDENIQNNINQADFVVIDWTSLNPNVLLEAGFSEGRAKPSINLSADEHMPSDKAGVIYAPYNPNDLNKLPEKLMPLIFELIKRIEEGPRVFDYYDERSTDLVRRMILGAEKEIRILQTNLETVNANHLVDLAEALRKEVKVRILTLDPQSRYVNERALQLGYITRAVKIYRAGLQNSIDNTIAQLSRFSGFSLRLYNDFPNQLTYLFDYQILACVISRTGRSRTNCTFLLPSSRLRGPKHSFVDHFEQLWDKAEQESQEAPEPLPSG